VDEALKVMSLRFGSLYARACRPSVPPQALTLNARYVTSQRIAEVFGWAKEVARIRQTRPPWPRPRQRRLLPRHHRQ